MGDKKGIGEAILGGLPIIGGIASSLLQRKWAVKDRDAQNEYNSPANQLKLLKEAGLPAVSYFGQGASAQSEQPRQVQPDLGTSEVFEKMALNQIHKKQMQIMDADIRMKNAEADLKEGETKFLLSPFFNRYTGRIDEGKTRQEGILQATMNIKGYEEYIKYIEEQLARKYKEKFTVQDLRTGELDNIIRGLSGTNMRLQTMFKEKLGNALIRDKAMSIEELARTMIGLKYMSQ